MTLTSLAFESIASIFTNMVLAMLVLLLGLALGQLIGKLTQIILDQFDVNIILSNAGLEIPAEQMIASTVRYIIYFVFIIFAASIVGIASQLFSVIAIIVSTIIIAYMLLGLRDFVPNAIAGIIITRRGLLKKGQTITSQGITGTVRHLTLTETRIITNKGDTISIPNAILIKQPLILRK